MSVQFSGVDSSSQDSLKHIMSAPVSWTMYCRFSSLFKMLLEFRCRISNSLGFFLMSSIFNGSSLSVRSLTLIWEELTNFRYF